MTNYYVKIVAAADVTSSPINPVLKKSLSDSMLYKCNITPSILQMCALLHLALHSPPPYSLT